MIASTYLKVSSYGVMANVQDRVLQITEFEL